MVIVALLFFERGCVRDFDGAVLRIFFCGWCGDEEKEVRRSSTIRLDWFD
jgi:hypothetical protein